MGLCRIAIKIRRHKMEWMAREGEETLADATLLHVVVQKLAEGGKRNKTLRLFGNAGCPLPATSFLLKSF